MCAASDPGCVNPRRVSRTAPGRAESITFCIKDLRRHLQSRVLMSAKGQKRTLQCILVMSALPPSADIAERDWHVRFVRRVQPVDARGRGRSARLGAGVAPEALSPGSPRQATMARRAQARTAVVAGADRRLAEAATPSRPRHADIARNDLSKSLYSDPRRAEETADGASADGPADASSQGRHHTERTGTDRRYGLHPRTASRG